MQSAAAHGAPVDRVVDDADNYADDSLFLYQPPVYSAASGAGQFRIASYSATSTAWLNLGGSGGSFDTLGESYAVLRLQDAPSSSPLLMDTTYRVPASDVAGVWAWRWNTAPNAAHPAYGFHPGLSMSLPRTIGQPVTRTLDGKLPWPDRWLAALAARR